jgi:hypothetical protein
VDRLGRPFVGLCHFSQEDFDKPKSLGPKARSHSAVPGSGKASPAFHAAFAEGKKPCSCDMLQRILGVPAHKCPNHWNFNMAAEFWVSGARIAKRDLAGWSRLLGVAVGGNDVPRFGHHNDGSKASAAGYCFESVWHALFGEPLEGYLPAFSSYLGDIPFSPASERCRATAATAAATTITTDNQSPAKPSRLNGTTTIDGSPAEAVGVTAGASAQGGAAESSAGHSHHGGLLGELFPSHAAGRGRSGTGRSEKTVLRRKRKLEHWAYLTGPSPGNCGPRGG